MWLLEITWALAQIDSWALSSEGSLFVLKLLRNHLCLPDLTPCLLPALTYDLVQRQAGSQVSSHLSHPLDSTHLSV